MADYVTGCLWFVPIAFMFYCQHHVCEEYFIPAINVLVSTAQASPNKWIQRWGESAVAGATIMALGCNGPELFCNLISLYIGSDAGIGVVIGSEIFNLLIIIGCSVIFCPTINEGPMELEKASFVRDCGFYLLSIVLLVWALMINTPNQVDPFEAQVLLAAEVLFITAVYFTSDIVGGSEAPAAVAKPDPSKSGATAAIHGVNCRVTEIMSGRMQASGGGAAEMTLDPTAQGIYVSGDEPAAKGPTPNKRGSVGFSFAGGTGNMSCMKYEDLREVRVAGVGVIYMDFAHSSWETVSLKIECETAGDRDELLKLVEENSLAKPYIHEYNPYFCSIPQKDSKEAVFLASDRTGLQKIPGALDHLKHAFHDAGYTWDMKLLACVEFIADCMLKTTLASVDVKDIKKEGRWPLCFMGAMGWLAVYSFLMLEVATQINMCIPQLSMAFLGVTVCAIGTSFPNAIASILMSKQGKSAAAIANALGSNVQNVFLAMACPWLIYMATPTAWSYYLCVEPREQWTPVPQEPPTKGQSVVEGVEWMLGTLVLVVFMALLPPTCTFSRSYGVFLCCMYIVYLTWTSYEALAPSPHVHASAPATHGNASLFIF